MHLRSRTKHASEAFTLEDVADALEDLSEIARAIDKQPPEKTKLFAGEGMPFSKLGLSRQKRSVERQP